MRLTAKKLSGRAFRSTGYRRRGADRQDKQRGFHNGGQGRERSGGNSRKAGQELAAVGVVHAGKLHTQPSADRAGRHAENARESNAGSAATRCGYARRSIAAKASASASVSKSSKQSTPP